MIFKTNEIKKESTTDDFGNTINYVGMYNEKGNIWYEELKKFKKDTLKIMYNNDTLQVLSTNKEASFLAPTMVGDVVEEIYIL